jgi:N-acetylmuramoyl-L-alanine amidase
VLDLSGNVKPKSFLLKPHKSYGHRLVIDLQKKALQKTAKTRTSPVLKKNQQRDLVIAIDAGHGGEDPGAIGHRGTREKDVVMAIARKLERLISRQRGMRAVMVRDSDYYIGLRKRVEIARKHKADMFISIHADAFHNKSAKGASVYALSQRGASNETARWLAESENASDFIGGVSLEDKDDLLTSVLLDLSMNGKVEASLELGDYVLSELKGVSRVHKRNVGQAGFAVLKSPDIPSILVETAFISNPSEEKKLRSPSYQQKMAESILKGVRTYFARNEVPGTLLAQRRHVIARGENLSVIADQYNVSLKELRTQNALKTDRLKVGEVLLIPGG